MNALVKPTVPIDSLESDLISSWRDVSQATHRFLVLLREFDLRQGWKEWGCADCADWLNLKCGITRNTAQEKVRVARALWSLPQTEEAFKRGDLSYSKVRALTRVACDSTEADLLHYALTSTAMQVEAHCRRLRNGGAGSTADARRAHEGRSLFRTYREDGTGTLNVELPREQLDLVLAALEKVAATLPATDDGEESGSLFARGADALVAMSKLTLSGEAAGGSSSDQYQVVVHVDAAALECEGAGGASDLPVETVKRLCCDGSVLPVVEAEGEPLSVGRKQRTVPTAIRRALDARDRTCTFPGCSHDKWIDAHHVHHWADGGETAVDNLLLLCSHHHRLVHEGGFTVERSNDGTVCFLRPDGRPVESSLSAESEVRDGRAVYLVADEAVVAVRSRRQNERGMPSTCSPR